MKYVLAILCSLLIMSGVANAQCGPRGCGVSGGYSMPMMGGCSGGSCGVPTMGYHGGLSSIQLAPGGYNGWGYQPSVSYVPSTSAIRVSGPVGGFNFSAGYSYPKGAVNDNSYPIKVLPSRPVLAPATPMHFNMIGTPHCLQRNFSYNPDWQRNDY